MKFKMGLLFVVLIGLLGVTAQSQAKKETPAPDTKELMDQFLIQLTALKMYFVTEEKFLDPANTAKISEHLKNFAELAKQAKHDPQLNQTNFKFSAEVLESHIVDTERVFRLGNKNYARWQLISTLSVCMSCHTQLPSSSRSFGEFNNLKIYSSDFDRAEFLFATRSFDKAYAIYEKIIEGYPGNKASFNQLEIALQRELSYFIRIKNDPTLAYETMLKNQKNKNLPAVLQSSLAAWLQPIQDWKKSPSINPKTATEKQIIEFAQKSIEKAGQIKSLDANNPHLVTYLRVSGVLYEYLNAHPGSAATPEVLYWLSICDRAINNNFFFSLSNIYLRECMIKYPSHKIAEKCYKEYEDDMIFGYTGSSGTHLPGEVKEELLRLKKRVDSKGKIELKGNQ